MTNYQDIWYTSDDGLRLYARDYPCRAGDDAPLLLCMHGLTRNSADFHDLALHLCEHYRVVVVDQRGRGRSDYDSHVANYTPLTYVQDMWVLLDLLNAQQVILIGTSMGGLMAMLMTAMQGRRIRAVVLNDIGPELDQRGLDRIKNYVGKSAPVTDWDEAVAQAKKINRVAFPDFSETQWHDFTHGIYHDEKGVPVLSYDPAIAQPMQADDSNAVPPDLWPVFDALIEIPLLVIRGALSDLLALECVAKMRTRKPDLIAVDIPQRGHAPTLTEPDALTAIEAFLSAVEGHR